MTADNVAVATLVSVAITGVATAVLAWRTSNMAGSTRQMAGSTELAAKAARDGIELQRDELEAVRKELQHAAEQLTLTRDQLDLTRKQFELADKRLDLANRQFEQTAEVVKQQLKQAEAMAIVAQETQRERELAIRPYLTVEVLKPPYKDDLMIHNVGRGPALNCIWTFVDKGAIWRHSKVFSVAPATGRQLRSNDIDTAQPGRSTPLILWDYGQLNDRGEHEVAEVHALFCQDETGTRLYRFIDRRVGYDVWEASEPEPPWVTSLLQEFPDLRPDKASSA